MVFVKLVANEESTALLEKSTYYLEKNRSGHRKYFLEGVPNEENQQKLAAAMVLYGYCQ